MSQDVDIGYSRVKSLISNMKESTKEDVIFDNSKIVAFVEKSKSCKTVRRVIDSTSVDELNYMLTLINLYYNSQILYQKIINIFKSVNSNYSVDYYKEMMNTIEVNNGSD